MGVDTPYVLLTDNKNQMENWIGIIWLRKATESTALVDIHFFDKKFEEIIKEAGSHKVGPSVNIIQKDGELFAIGLTPIPTEIYEAD